MGEARHKSLKPVSDSSGGGVGLAQVPKAHKQVIRSEEEYEGDLMFRVRRQAILDEARENNVIYDLSDCFAKDLDALEAKLAASPLNATKVESSKGEQSEVTEAFCQAHLARVVDLAQASAITVTRQGQPLVVVLSPEHYAALSARHPAA